MSISASTTDSSLYLRTSLPCRIREGDYNGELNRLLFPQPPLYLSNPPSITIPLLLPPPHPLGPGIRRGRQAAGARRVRHRLWRHTALQQAVHLLLPSSSDTQRHTRHRAGECSPHGSSRRHAPLTPFMSSRQRRESPTVESSPETLNEKWMKTFPETFVTDD